MNARERERLFQEAMYDYRDGLRDLARRSLKRLVDDGSRDPAHISFYGLLLAETEKSARAISLCEEAVSKDGRRSSLLYLNLSRALAAVADRKGAIEALSRGLVVHPGDRKLRRELQHLVPRRSPLFPRLGRQHFVNKYAGIARTVNDRVWSSIAGRV